MTRQEREIRKSENRKRSEYLKNWFSSFFITVGVVIVVVAFVPKSPVAQISKIQEFSDAVTYQVSVTDEDQAIIDGTLIVTIENQFTSYEQTLETGISVGLFEELEANTEYTLKVLANKGFGLEVLAQTKIRTLEKCGASVIQAESITPNDSMMLFYNIKTYSADPLDEISAFYLTVQYQYSIGETPYLVGTYPIEEGIYETMVEGIPNQNVQIIIRVYGTSVLGDTLMDELIISSPLRIEGSLYLQRVMDDSISVGAYAGHSKALELEYTLNLYNRHELIDSLTITIPDSFEEQYMEEPTYEFSHLRNNTTYRIEFVANYVDPVTYQSVSVVIASVEATTLYPYDFTYQVQEFDDHYEVSIQLNDSMDQFQYASYTAYGIVDGMREYSGFGSESFVNESGVKSLVIIIDKPAYQNYKIEISIQSNTQYTNSELITTISSK